MSVRLAVSADRSISTPSRSNWLFLEVEEEGEGGSIVARVRAGSPTDGLQVQRSESRIGTQGLGKITCAIRVDVVGSQVERRQRAVEVEHLGEVTRAAVADIVVVQYDRPDGLVRANGIGEGDHAVIVDITAPEVESLDGAVISYQSSKLFDTSI